MQIIKSILESIGVFVDNEKNEMAVKETFASLHSKLVSIIETIGYDNHKKLQESFRNAFETATELGLFGSELEKTPTGQSKIKSRKQGLVRRINTAWKTVQVKNNAETLYRFKGQSFSITEVKVKAKPTFQEALESLLERYNKPIDNNLFTDIETAVTAAEKRIEERKAEMRKQFKTVMEKRDAERLFDEMNKAGLKWNAGTVKKYLNLKGEKITDKKAEKMVSLV